MSISDIISLATGVVLLVNGYMYLSGRATKTMRTRTVVFGVLFIIFGILNFVVLLT